VRCRVELFSIRTEKNRLTGENYGKNHSGRQLRKGVEPLVDCKNKDVVVSLREIAAGKIFQIVREIAAGKIFQIEKAEDGLLLENGEASTPEEIPEKAPEMSPEQEQGEQETTAEGK